MLLKDKTILITGASSGIGYAMANLMAREGARLILGDINQEQGELLAAKLNSMNFEAIFAKCDVSQPSQAQDLVDLALEHFGKLDGACNNAGISGITQALADMPIEEWKRVQSINLDGVFYGLRAQIPAMLKNNGGSIVNTASIMAQVSIYGSCAYTASKHGVLGLTKSAAIDYGQQGIRVNAIGPAFIDTPMTTPMNAYPEILSKVISAHPLRRFGHPNEIAELATWLLSDRASFITGAYYPADGGYLSQ